MAAILDWLTSQRATRTKIYLHVISFNLIPNMKLFHELDLTAYLGTPLRMLLCNFVSRYPKMKYEIKVYFPFHCQTCFMLFIVEDHLKAFDQELFSLKKVYFICIVK